MLNEKLSAPPGGVSAEAAVMVYVVFAAPAGSVVGGVYVIVESTTLGPPAVGVTVFV
jgi:hypothetical protein